MSAACLTGISRAIDHADAVERVPVRIDPSSFEGLSEPEQLFAETNLERQARGLAPFEYLLRPLDTLAARGARSDQDPEPPGGRFALGGAVLSWSSNWAKTTYNSLGAQYYWMFEDGPGGFNLACLTPNAPGCWGHRDNILRSYGFGTRACAGQPVRLAMGAAAARAVSDGRPSFAEVFVAACPFPKSEVVRTWTSLHRLLLERAHHSQLRRARALSRVDMRAARRAQPSATR